MCLSSSSGPESAILIVNFRSGRIQYSQWASKIQLVSKTFLMIHYTLYYSLSKTKIKGVALQLPIKSSINVDHIATALGSPPRARAYRHSCIGLLCVVDREFLTQSFEIRENSRIFVIF